MIYGREITNASDSAALNAVIEYWISSIAARRDFEICRGK